MKNDLYPGRWRLMLRSGAIRFAIQWQASGGSDHSIAFSGPAEGSLQPAEGLGASEFSISRISNAVLDGAAFLDGEEIMHSRRSASLDGRLLSTIQTGMAGERPFRNFQVYCRDDT